MSKSRGTKAKRPAKAAARKKPSPAAAAAPEKSRFTKDLFRPVPLKAIRGDAEIGDTGLDKYGVIERDTKLAIRELLHVNPVNDLIQALADELEPCLTRRLPKSMEDRRENVRALIITLRLFADDADDDCTNIAVYGDPLNAGM
jgi:hypothetical protein